MNATVDNQPFNVTQAQVSAVKSNIGQFPAPAHKIQYINDGNVEMYRTNAAVVRGGVSNEGDAIRLTNWQNVVACEQYDASDKLIAVTTGTSFVRLANAAAVYAVGATGERVRIGD